MKPKVKIIGENENVFNLLGICGRVLKKAGQVDKSKEMSERVLAARSYEESLQIMSEYCELY